MLKPPPNITARIPGDSSEFSYAWTIDLFGRLVAHRRAEPQDTIKRFQTSKTGALLGLLAFQVGRQVSRETIIDEIWPDADYEAARHNLNQSLTSLRKQLEPPGTKSGTVIQATHVYVSLNADVVTTDVQVFSSLLHQADATNSLSQRIAVLLEAMDLYGGDLLPGYMHEWTLIERERLNLSYLACVRNLSEALEELDKPEQAIGVLYKGARVAPTDEEICRRLMRLLTATGKPVVALEHYNRSVKHIRNLEDRAPATETRNLAETLRAQCRAAGHRVKAIRGKRLPKNVAIREIAGQDVDAVRLPARLKDIGHTKPSPAALPTRLTRFFGRQEELAALLAMLAPRDAEVRTSEDDENRELHDVQIGAATRLVSIIGPGGSGKTRLALEAVAHYAEQSAGRFLFVPLADVTNEAAIAPAILHALDLRDIGNTEPLQQVVDALTGSDCLLALDNMEHLLPQARSVVGALLHKLPRLRCLVTSQQAVSIEGEQEMPLAPLLVPDVTNIPVDALQWDVVKLFVDRAQLVRPDFQITPRNAAVVCQICRQLDGIPLAIELAASRVQALSAGEVLEELTNRFGFLANRKKSDRRHRTLEDALSWSFDLLSEESKKVFLELSVFRGGWTLEAARSVGEEEDILAVLEDLVGRSMIFRTDAGDVSRYRMLETMRRFASQQLAESFTTQYIYSLLEKHATYYYNLAVRRERMLRGKSSGSTITELRTDGENINASLSWLLGDQKWNASAVTMIGALWRYWYWSGALREGRQWLERAFQVIDAGFVDQSLKLFIGAGAITRLLGDMQTAREYLERGLSRCEYLGVKQSSAEELKLAMGDLYIQLGILDDEIGQSKRAISHYEQAGLIRHGVLDRWSDASLLSNLGRAEQKLGMLDKAAEHYIRSAAVVEDEGDLLQAAAIWNNLGTVNTERGDLIAARAAFEASRDIFIEQGNQWAAAMPMLNLGEVLQIMGLLDQAKKELKACLVLRRELGDKPGIPYCLLNLGSVAVSEHRYVYGVHLLLAAQTMFEQLGTPLPLFAVDTYQHDLSIAKEHLSLADFETAASYGCALFGERAINYALSL